MTHRPFYSGSSSPYSSSSSCLEQGHVSQKITNKSTIDSSSLIEETMTTGVKCTEQRIAKTIDHLAKRTMMNFIGGVDMSLGLKLTLIPRQYNRARRANNL